jgi:hypothetical protein
MGGIGVSEGVRVRVGTRVEGGVRGSGVRMAVGVVGMASGAGLGDAGIEMEMGEGGADFDGTGDGGVSNVNSVAVNRFKNTLKGGKEMKRKPYLL